MPPKYQFSSRDIIRSGRVEQAELDQLKSWCGTQNLPILSDEQLVLFLLACYKSPSAMKNAIKVYFKCKTGAPALFHNRNLDAADVQQATKICDFSLMPTRTNDNDAIVLWRFKNTSYSSVYHFDLESIMKVLIMVGEISLYQDPPDGMIVILDIKGVSLLHISKLMKFSALQTFFRYVQEGYPCKMKQIHIFNTIYFIEKIMMMLKPFLNDELRNKIIFHQSNMDREDFFEKYLPRDCLPEDYGGSLPSQRVLSIQTLNLCRGMENFYKDEEDQLKQCT